MQNAKKNYDHTMARIRKELATINKLLDEHQAEAANEPTNWCYVGDLGHVVQELTDVRLFLQNYDETH